MRSAALYLLGIATSVGVAHAAPVPIVGGLPSVAGEFPTVVALTVTYGNSTATCT